MQSPCLKGFSVSAALEHQTLIISGLWVSPAHQGPTPVWPAVSLLPASCCSLCCHGLCTQVCPPVNMSILRGVATSSVDRALARGGQCLLGLGAELQAVPYTQTSGESTLMGPAASLWC